MPSLRPRLLITTAVLAAAAALPATASADSLVAPAPGAVNLASGGGHLAWAQPNEDTGWRLVVRAPDGTTTSPAAGFAGPPDASIGSGSPLGNSPTRPLLAVYARPDATGNDTDIYALDLRTGRESRVRGASTSRYRESAPSIAGGQVVFVRRAGARNGVHFVSRSGTVRRVSRDTPRETATNGSRVAYGKSRSVVVLRLSREGRPLVQRTAGVPLGVTLTRYRVSWLIQGGRVFQTPRFGGSGTTLPVGDATEGRTLPSTANDIALLDDRVQLYTDAEGVKRADPRPFPRG